MLFDSLQMLKIQNIQKCTVRHIIFSLIIQTPIVIAANIKAHGD